MKTLTHYIILMLLALLTACNSNDKSPDSKEFLLQGAWVQTAVTMPNGETVEYPNSSGFTHLLIFENDSVLYTSQVQFTQAGTLVNPEDCGSYRLLYRGGGEYIFIRDGEQLPFSLLNDTTFVLQEMGMTRTFSTDHKLSERQKDEVKCITIAGEKGYQCMFSTKEEELRVANSTLIYIIIGVVMVLAVVGLFAFRTHRSKLRVEKQLRLIMEEKAMRPAEVQEALETVEKAFLKSDYYISLMHRIESGSHLAASDFIEIETHLKRVYPGFTTSLRSLCSMSSIEYQVCLLTKLQVPPTDIAATLCKSKSAISAMRSRLYQKVFNKKGSSTEWDEFVRKM